VSYGAVSHILLAGFVVLMIVVITRLFSGFVSQVAVLIAILLGTLLAWPMGLLHFTSVNTVDWFGGPSIFHFGGPRFQASAIISMCIVILVTDTESTADMLAVGEMVDKDVSPSELARGLRTDGLSAFIASFTNSFPDTAYAENVGIVGMTGPVIGGAATVMFAMVTAIGIRTLAKVNFEGNNNLLIIAVSLSIGLIPAVAPTFYSKFPANFQVIFGSSITSTVIIVFVLNLVFNHWVNWPPRAGMLRTAMSFGAVTPTETPAQTTSVNG
jgi:xanthine/uracil permease